MRLKVDVQPTGTNTATVIVTQEQVDAIRGSQGRARVPLVIRYQGAEFRTSVSIYRGQWMVVVNREMRAAGLIPDHSYTVDIARDTAERTVEVPADLNAALEAEGLRETFDTLSYSNRREHVRAIEDAKKPETRQRRIAATVAKVASGVRR